MYPRCRHDFQPALKASVEEYVAWEKWQKNQLSSVLPPTRGLIQWEPGVESLTGKNLSHYFLVLVTRINNIPIGGRVNVSIVRDNWPAKHAAPPWDLQELTVPCKP